MPNRVVRVATSAVRPRVSGDIVLKSGPWLVNKKNGPDTKHSVSDSNIKKSRSS